MRKAPGFVNNCIFRLVAVAVLVQPGYAEGQSPSVRHREGSSRGFLVLRNEKGATLASGEVSEISHGDTVRLRMVFYFRDGSVDEETTVYSQRSAFRLISDRVVQRGRSFPHPCEINIDVRSQLVKVRACSEGNNGTKTERMELPSELSNGLLFNLIKNLQTDDPKFEVLYLAPSAKPRLVKLAISLEKEQEFTIAGRAFKAAEWDVKPELGGLAGIVAPMIGKQPPDSHVWVAEGSVPAVVRVDTQLYLGGPVWSIQLSSPVW